MNPGSRRLPILVQRLGTDPVTYGARPDVAPTLIMPADTMRTHPAIWRSWCEFV